MKSTSTFQKETLNWCRFHNTAATKNLSKNIDIEFFTIYQQLCTDGNFFFFNTHPICPFVVDLLIYTFFYQFIIIF